MFRSDTPKVSGWYNDSGEALGGGNRRLGALEELLAETGKSVYVGNGDDGDVPGTVSFRYEREPEWDESSKIGVLECEEPATA